MKANRIRQEDVRKWLGRPVWFQSREDVRDFGWAFIHPDSVRLGYLKLIRPNPSRKDFYSWDGADLYDRPFFHGICSRCIHWLPNQLVRCGKEGARCTHVNRYKDFEADTYWHDRGYTAETFIRQLALATLPVTGGK